MRFRTWPSIALVVACVSVSAVGAIYLTQGGRPTAAIASVAPPSSSDFKTILGGPQVACADGGVGNPLAMVGHVARGHTVGEIEAAGYGVHGAIDGVDPSLVVLYGSKVDLSAATTSTAVAGVDVIGYLYPRTADRSLAACSYRLSDNPTAAAYATIASNALVQHKDLTPATIAASSTTFTLSDDPADAAVVIVSVMVPVTYVTPDVHALLTDSIAVYAVEISRSNRAVLGAGRAWWFAGH